MFFKTLLFPLMNVGVIIMKICRSWLNRSMYWPKIWKTIGIRNKWPRNFSNSTIPLNSLLIVAVQCCYQLRVKFKSLVALSLRGGFHAVTKFSSSLSIFSAAQMELVSRNGIVTGLLSDPRYFPKKIVWENRCYPEFDLFDTEAWMRTVSPHCCQHILVK